MRLFLCSGGLSTAERREVFKKELHEFLGPITRLTFLPYAGGDHPAYVKRMIELEFNVGRELIGLHEAVDPVRAIEEAECLYLGGGNSFRLLADLYRLNLIEPIKKRVLAGVPYIGISAGTNMACPTMKTTNDMPIVAPPALEALALIPFQINPHYFQGAIYYKTGEDFIPYGGETRDDRLREFHEMNATPVVGLYEGGILRIEGSRAQLRGAYGCRIFRQGRAVEDRGAGADLSDLLRGV